MTKSDIELKASAERLKRLYGGESYRSVYGTEQTQGGFQQIDERKVLDAWFAENDETPLTEEWLRSVGFSKDGEIEFHPGVLCVYTSQIGAEIRIYVAGWNGCNHRFDLPVQKTRGDVRRLASALGITLQQPQSKE